MLLHTVYGVLVPEGKSLGINIPFTLTIDDNTKASLVKHKTGLRLLIERKIDPSKLVLEKSDKFYKVTPAGKKEPIPTLKLVDDEPQETIVSQDILSGLTFITDTPLSLNAPPGENQFVAETAQDRKLLKGFGTSKPSSRASGQVSMRSFNSSMTTETLLGLMPRRAGLRLYANAIKANLAVAQYRELWRILEAAFGKLNYDLVDLVAQYPPAKQLGFDKPELKRLLVLRGRASHAQSSSGVKELALVDRECSKQLPRLKNLCERVILTKKTWGRQSLATDELLPLDGYIGQDNSITIFQAPANGK